MAQTHQGALSEIEPFTVPPLKIVFEKADRDWILQEIDDCLSSGWVAAGKHVAQFEEFWADYCNCPHSVACGSGGAALELIMKAMDIKGKDVLVPTNTFVATVNAIIFAGGKDGFAGGSPDGAPRR